MARSYADAVSSGGTEDAHGKSDERMSVRHSEVKRRTQVLYKVPSRTTAENIMQEIDSQFATRVFDVVETVVADHLDARRFYIVYVSVDARKQIAGSGFKIGRISIPPEKGQLPVYIPHLPYYINRQDIDGLLRPYGTVTEGRFRRDSIRGKIRTGGTTVT